MGCRIAVIPAENVRYREEIPAEIRDHMTTHLVNHMDEVIALVLGETK